MCISLTLLLNQSSILLQGPPKGELGEMGVALSLFPMWPHWTNIIFLFSIINLIFLNWHIEDGRLNLT